jgi:type I restriction enzyme S subunit
LRAGHVRDTHIDFDGVDRFRAELAERVRPKSSQPGDVVITTKGNSTGRMAYVDTKMPSFVYSPHLSYWRSLDAEGVNPGYLRYWSRSDYFVDQLRGMAASTDMAPYLSLIDQRRLRIELPDAGEQRAIAHVLGTLDDKIELNRKMSETLEAMARAIFQSWFVDFDPVRAKARGEQPGGMSAEMAALFPSEFEESELGPIPKGWRVRRVAEVAERIAMGPFGSNIKTDNFVPDGVPIVRGNNLKDGFVDAEFVFLTEEKADELSNAVAIPGDLVFTHRGTLGQVGLIPAQSRYPRYVVSQSQMLLRANRRVVGPEYLYLFFRLPIGRDQLLANTNATGVPAIARPTSSLKEIRVVEPSPEVMRRFGSAAERLFGKARQSNEEAKTLAALRDTLLPRLISGKLRVAEAEKLARDAKK